MPPLPCLRGFPVLLNQLFIIGLLIAVSAFFSMAEITPLLRGAGFEIVESREREPYEGVEHPSRRAYLMARRAG